MITKPQIHQSDVDAIAACGIRWQRRRGYLFGVADKEEIMPPGIAMSVGTATHESVAVNLRHKMANDGQLLPRDQVAQAARDEISELTSGELLLSDVEAVNKKATIGAAIDLAVALATCHHDNLASSINPIAIEEPFVIELPDQPYDVSGQIDVREEGVIRDTKTCASSGVTKYPQYSFQLAIYATAHEVLFHHYPDRVVLDHLVKNKTPKVDVREGVIGKAQAQYALDRVFHTIKIIESVRKGHGEFSAADPSHPWACTKQYCGYARTCPFWSGR